MKNIIFYLLFILFSTHSYSQDAIQLALTAYHFDQTYLYKTSSSRQYKGPEIILKLPNMLVKRSNHFPSLIEFFGSDQDIMGGIFALYLQSVEKPKEYINIADNIILDGIYDPQTIKDAFPDRVTIALRKTKYNDQYGYFYIGFSNENNAGFASNHLICQQTFIYKNIMYNINSTYMVNADNPLDIRTLKSNFEKLNMLIGSNVVISEKWKF